MYIKEKPAYLRHKRSIFTGPGDSRKWQSQPILYYLDTTINTVLDVIAKIERSLENWSKNSCVRFKSTATPGNADYISFESNPVVTQCMSSLGRQGGKQAINIRPECTTVRAISMLIGRALGIIYEVERKDRDNYIIIDTTKVDTNLQIDLKEVIAEDFNIPYEYGSLMQFYEDELRTANISGPVFIVKDPAYSGTIGSSIESTFYDITTLNRYYCNSSCPTTSSQCLYFGYPNPNDCRTCFCPSGYGGSRCNEAQTSTTGDNLCPNGVGLLEMSESTPPLIINSPGWPDQAYSLGSKCIWNVKALCTNGTKGKLRIEVNATRFDLTKATTGQCLHWLEVKYKRNQALTGVRLCGVLPQQIGLNSESDRLIAIFEANLDSRQDNNQPPLIGKGFKATISLVPNSCNEPQESENSIYTPWSNWSPCSQPCGGCGVQKRFRRCMLLCSDLSDCPCHPIEVQFRDCNPFICDVSGETEYECFDQNTISEPRIGDLKRCTRTKMCCDGYLPLNSVCISPDLLYNFIYK